MAYDLDKMSKSELTKLGRDVEKALRDFEKREQKAALEAAERAAQEYGFSLSQLTGAGPKGKAKGGAKNPPKYRNPHDAAQTWSGRGRKPAWVNEAEAAGRDISEFAI